MKVLSSLTRISSRISKWIAYIILILMMITIGIAALLRGLGHPILGDVELVQLGMVLIIVGSLAYTEQTDSHIKIGIIADNFPDIVQKIIDVCSYVLTIVFAGIVAYTFIIKFEMKMQSNILRIPFYPLKIFLIIGFVTWCLVAVDKLIQKVRND